MPFKGFPKTSKGFENSVQGVQKPFKGQKDLLKAIKILLDLVTSLPKTFQAFHWPSKVFQRPFKNMFTGLFTVFHDFKKAC